mgnify:CR=1 FL=1
MQVNHSNGLNSYNSYTEEAYQLAANSCLEAIFGAYITSTSLVQDGQSQGYQILSKVGGKLDQLLRQGVIPGEFKDRGYRYLDAKIRCVARIPIGTTEVYTQYRNRQELRIAIESCQYGRTLQEKYQCFNKIHTERFAKTNLRALSDTYLQLCHGWRTQEQQIAAVLYHNSMEQLDSDELDAFSEYHSDCENRFTEALSLPYISLEQTGFDICGGEAFKIQDRGFIQRMRGTTDRSLTGFVCTEGLNRVLKSYSNIDPVLKNVIQGCGSMSRTDTSTRCEVYAAAELGYGLPLEKIQKNFHRPIGHEEKGRYEFDRWLMDQPVGTLDTTGLQIEVAQCLRTLAERGNGRENNVKIAEEIRNNTKENRKNPGALSAILRTCNSALQLPVDRDRSRAERAEGFTSKLKSFADPKTKSCRHNELTASVGFLLGLGAGAEFNYCEAPNAQRWIEFGLIGLLSIGLGATVDVASPVYESPYGRILTVHSTDRQDFVFFAGPVYEGPRMFDNYPSNDKAIGGALGVGAFGTYTGKINFMIFPLPDSRAILLGLFD